MSPDARPPSPFHRGEQAAQRIVGVREKMEGIGQRVIRNAMPDQHREFFAQLPMVLVGAVDADGVPWASILTGEPGFLASPDAHTLQVTAALLPGDPLATAIHPSAQLGLLGIELHTRRRNRMNGTVTRLDAAGFTLRVDQSFGNCPKYIQKRQFVVAPPVAEPVREQGHALDDDALAAIAHADTFFIATHYAGDGGPHGADVSHRGGKPGFVRVDDAGTLVWPEFTGNFMFNTLGNLLVNPRAGLLFPDFDNGDLLYLAGQGKVIWQGPDVEAYAGAERIVRFRIERLVRLRAALPLRWQWQERSPFLAATGDWQA